MHKSIVSNMLQSIDSHPQRGERTRQERGFALIATISVMVLLVMVALAMLSLSSIEMRAARNGDAQELAKANARLAMMFALGELQKQAGPDQRVTATGGIIDEDANHKHVAGVWKSWRPDPFSSPSSYDSIKEAQFENWLVSHLDRDAIGQTSFADNGSFSNPVEMLGDGTLGPTANSRDFVTAGKIPLTPTRPTRGGNMAWVIMDEGVKARVNLPLVKNSGSLAESSSNLGAASRAALEKVEPKFNPDTGGEEKFITLAESELGMDTDMGKYAHDLTVWSQGPMTNVVDGGLREDLNLMTDGATLPAEFAGKRVYSGGVNGIAGADPHWQQVFDYASSYKRVTNVGGVPQIDATVPAGYAPVKWDTSKGGYTAVKDPPKGQILMPVVAKVQVVFSLVARRAHGGWGGNIRNTTGDSQRAFMLHMIYSPVVTLHNPYNVAMKFDKMRLEFQNVPVAFKFYRNNQPQTTRLMPLSQLYVWTQNNSNASKAFTMTLQGKGASGSPGGAVTLRPGEVRVFSPYLPPNHSWATDRPGDGNTYFDWRNDKTRNITAIPGWQGEGVGFDIDWLTPTGSLTSFDDRMGVLSLRWADTVKVDYAPYAPTAAKNRMAIISTLYRGSSLVRSGVIEMDYGSTADLQKMLPAPSGKRYTYPQAGEAAISCGQIYEPDGRLIRDYEKVKSFCMFSAYGKTAFGGTAGNADGRHATKAWSFSNPVSSVSSSDLKNEHGSHHSHELNFETMPGHAENQVQVDADDRGNYITGHTALNGLKFGTHNEVPIAPIQSLASLQNANLCSSGYLPKFDYPVANSFAHPLMPPGVVRDGDKLDHSYLLNHYLYDRFYCSTVSAYTGAMFGPKTRSTQTVLEGFLNGTKPLLDHRFTSWKPSGKTTAQILTEVVGTGAGKEGYRKVAAYQMLRGEWNVNSVSKEAWKAVLGGLHSTDFPLYDALANTISTRTYAENPMSRYRLPNGVAQNGSSSNPAEARRNRWTGYRELEDDELDELAEFIVEEVRTRGPFLSLTEFVNRRLSGNSDMTLVGALQAAINRTKINDVLAADGRVITRAEVATYKYQNVDAAIGHSSQGAPGSVTQGHIMNALGNAATVRSNTFTIRSYGESVDNKGRVQARAWCEAVVQRIPEYLDKADEPHINTVDLGSEANKNFGRRIRVISFRWLGSEEI